MKLLIDIPEWLYQDIQEYLHPSPLDKVIQNGIPLPKRHGRLIDADAYRKEMLDSREFDFFKRLDMQPTIIEADKEKENG